MDAIQSMPDSTVREIADLLGVHHSTVVRYRRLLAGARTDVERRNDLIEVPELASPLAPVEQLIERRIKEFELRDKAARQRELVPVRVKANGPIGIAWFGDPHLDDDGTDIAAIKRHVDLVKATDGMFAANIGDGHNNWMGRLARLYAYQGTSEMEAWQLVEWFIKELPWLIFLDGNHGAWSGPGNPVRWMLSNANSLHDETDVRLELSFPNGMKSRIFARHDFPGSSQWNTTHGVAKATKMHGFDDSLLICGHLHTDGYQIVPNPNTGVLSHCVRVSGYKKHDKYAKDHFFVKNRIGDGGAVTVFDPRFPTSSPRHVRVFFDMEEGAEYLNYLRRKP